MPISEENMLLPLVEAVEAATGRRVNLATVWRWAVNGSKGTKLETRMFGGRRMTTPKLVMEFIDARSQATNP